MASARVPSRSPGRHFRPFLAVLALICAGFPTLAGAQPLAADEESLPQTPLERLLEHQDRLGLTGDQLNRIAAIRQRLRNANAPLVERMMRLREQWRTLRQGARNGRPVNAARLDRIRAAAEPIHARIQRNNRAAMRSVNRLLTADQRARLRAIVEEQRAREPAAGDAPLDFDADRGN